PPFAAEICDGRVFGRGAWDMKAGIAMNLTVLRAIRRMGRRLKGDLIFETVVDEEFGGVNGTLAGRLRGYNADGAVIGEPTALRLCPAQRGGRLLHILLQGRGGMLSRGRPAGRAVDHLGYVISRPPESTPRRKRRVALDRYFLNCPDPFA